MERERGKEKGRGRKPSPRKARGEEGKEGKSSWGLLRTVSFFSSRAKAIKERFTNRQRATSDNWVQQTSLDYSNIEDPAPAPSSEPEAGSMVSLLEETDEWGPAIVVQRSKSLESMSTFHRPSIGAIYSSVMPIQCTQSSVSIPVTPYARRPSTIMQSLPLPKRKEHLSVPSIEHIPQYFSTPLLQSPSTGDSDAELLAEQDYTPTAEEYQFQEVKTSTKALHHPSLSPILSRSRPCVPKAILSSSCNHITDSEIPKIPGPPSTPKKTRPCSTHSLDPSALDSRKDSPPPAKVDQQADQRVNQQVDKQSDKPTSSAKPLVDVSTPSQMKRSRPFTCLSFDPLIGQQQEQNPVTQTSSIPNLSNETSAAPTRRPPATPPRKAKLSSTQSLNPFRKQCEFPPLSGQSSSIPNLNTKFSEAEALPTAKSSDQFHAAVKPKLTEAGPSTSAPATPYKKKISFSSSSLGLNLSGRKPPLTFDPEQWRKYVEKAFPSIRETGECSLPSTSAGPSTSGSVKGKDSKDKAKDSKDKSKDSKDKAKGSKDKAKETAAAAAARKKPKQYSRLLHQTSVDETRPVQSERLSFLNRRRLYRARRQASEARERREEEREAAVSRAAAKEKEAPPSKFCLGNRCKSRGSTSSIVVPAITLEPEVGIEHLEDLRYPDADPICRFCSQQVSTAIHDESRLTIVSGGLVTTRDGSRENTVNPFMNLPSPMVNSELQNVEDDPVFQQHFGIMTRRENKQDYNDIIDERDAKPPPSIFHRRKAIVASKLTSSDSEEPGISWTASLSEIRAQHSSIVVIPPMQICPGDLLVYSKILTYGLDDEDGDGGQYMSTNPEHEPRKSRGPWSLLRMFERSGRNKHDGPVTFEDALNFVRRMDFDDKELSFFRGMTWREFYELVEDVRIKAEEIFDAKKEGRKSSLADTTVFPPIFKMKNLLVIKGDSDVEQYLSLDELYLNERSLIAEAVLRTLDRDYDDPKNPKCPLVRTQSEMSFRRPLLASLLIKDSSSSGDSDDDDYLGCFLSTGSLLSRGEYKRREAVWDLFQSECAFLFDHLMVLKYAYLEPLKRLQVEGYVMFAEPQLLFGNLEDLCAVTHNFCKHFIRILLARVGPYGELPTTEVLAQIYRRDEAYLFLSQSYHSYALNYINALNYLESLRGNLDFIEFEKWCNKDPRCKKLQLPDLLVAPVQHIMRVPLILKEVEARTHNEIEKVIVSDILQTEERSIRELDDKMKWLKNFERLLEIQKKLFWPPVHELEPKLYIPESLKATLQKQPCSRIVVSSRRQILYEGQLVMLDSGKPQEVFLFLFDDMLLITRRKKPLNKKKSTLSENWASSCRSSGNNEPSMRYVVYKQPLSLDRFFVYDISLPESVSCRLEYAFVLVVMNRFQQVVTLHSFQTPSDHMKQTWMKKLRDAQEKWKKTLENTMYKPATPQDSSKNAQKQSTGASMADKSKTSAGEKPGTSAGTTSAGVCSKAGRYHPSSRQRKRGEYCGDGDASPRLKRAHSF